MKVGGRDRIYVLTAIRRGGLNGLHLGFGDVSGVRDILCDVVSEANHYLVQPGF